MEGIGLEIDEGEIHFLVQSVHRTNNFQKKAIVKALHSKWCSATSSEVERQNSLSILCECVEIIKSIPESVLGNHRKYKDGNIVDKLRASVDLIEKLGLISILDVYEQYDLIASACKELWVVHRDWDNFYREVSFAKKLKRISDGIGAVPPPAQQLYVEVIVGCLIGNGYGVSRGSVEFYQDMVDAFSPAEIAFTLGLFQQNPTTQEGAVVYARIHNDRACLQGYKRLVGRFNEQSIPERFKEVYGKIMS